MDWRTVTTRDFQFADQSALAGVLITTGDSAVFEGKDWAGGTVKNVNKPTRYEFCSEYIPVVSIERQPNLEEVLNSPVEYYLNPFCDDADERYLEYTLTEIS